MKPEHLHPHVHSTWPTVAKIAAAASVIVTVVLLAFIWPTRTSTVKDLPIDVVGSAASAQPLHAQLNGVGAFTVHDAPTREDAVNRIQRRESYGAVVLPAQPGGVVEVLTASAASPVAAQIMGQVAAKAGAHVGEAAAEQGKAVSQAIAKAAASEAVARTLAKTAGVSAAELAAVQAEAAADGAAAAAAQAKVAAMKASAPIVTDIAPLTEADPRGAGLALAALPLALGGMIGGVLISMLVVGPLRRLVAVAAYSVFGGVLLALVLVSWLGVLPSFGHTFMVVTAALFATAAAIVGLNALMGRPGIALGAVITLFIGNPLASAAAPLEFLPGPWGAIGQLFVPGAGMTLLRHSNYFPDAPTLSAWLTVLCWSALGVALMMVGTFRDQEVVHLEGAVELDKTSHP